MICVEQKSLEAKHRECEKLHGGIHNLRRINGEYSIAGNGQYTRTSDGFILAKYKCVRCGMIQYFKVMI